LLNFRLEDEHHTAKIKDKLGKGYRKTRIIAPPGINPP